MLTEVSRFKKLKLSCFYSYLAMSAVFCLPPLLFVTFREMYGISYTLLGTLVLINFCTQMTIDLIFTFFSKYFNIRKTVCVMPLLTSAGLFIYALVPTFFPQYAYAGLVVGTVVFSISAGLSEVLISPLIAAIPSETPDRDMSALHSLYAYGVLTVVVVSTLFLWFVGAKYWMYLTMFWAVLSIGSSILFSTSPFPHVNVSHSAIGSAGKRQTGIFLCALCIFLGSAAENVMTNWISGYMENALQIPKLIGDILGMALFAVFLGLTRTWYAKRGKNIYRVLFLGMAGAALCYLTASLSPFPILSMVACALTGVCTAMLWPGTLILMEEKFSNPGVAAYALMAASGDFGASIAPQLMGVVTDSVAVSHWGNSFSAIVSIAPEQLGMKVGMLITALFPLLGIFCLLYIKKYFSKHSPQKL